ncbi:hypothetical protein GJ496_000416 [Pomphorhynchus laevis]|nr:hypothetical protein GJ496_000416 [Pomphorhynchus laevis]
MGIENTINRRYSQLLLHYPWCVILCVSSIALLFTILGLVRTDLPDFSDPSKGFFARGTGTMTGKLLILKELVERVKNSNNIKDETNVQMQSRLINDYEAGACVDDKDEPVLEQNDEFECILISNNDQGRTNWPSLNISTTNDECVMNVGQFKAFLPNYKELSQQSNKFSRCTTIPDIHSSFEFYFAVNNHHYIPFSVLMRDLCSADMAIHKQLQNSNVIDHDQSCHYSLAGLAADLFNHVDCSLLSTKEWNSFLTILQHCHPLAKSGLLYHLQERRAYIAYSYICEHVCFSPAVAFALNVGLDKYFGEHQTEGNFTIHKLAIWMPIRKNVSKAVARQQAVYEFRKFSKYQKSNDWSIRLEAVNMVNSRIFTAMQSIRNDMYLIVLAVCSILIISLMYTRSIVVCFVTVYNVILALGCAYTTYQLILQISIFPYINLMGFFLLVGLSCDNVFVFDDIWLKELRRNATHISISDRLPQNNITEASTTANSSSSMSFVADHHRCGNRFQITDPLSAVCRTLRHAAIALFITSCTTSAAFFTNLCSKIVYIQMFGLYLGLSIVFLFLVSVTILPAALIITHQGIGDSAAELATATTEGVALCHLVVDNSEQLPKKICKSKPVKHPTLSTRPTVNQRLFAWIKQIKKKIGLCSRKPDKGKKQIPSIPATGSVETNDRGSIYSFTSKLESIYSYIEITIFKKFLPDLIINNKNILPSILALFGLTGLIAVFVWPKMRFPENSRHRFFSSNDHLMEYFEFNVQDDVRLYYNKNQDEITYPQFIFIFGVSDIDNKRFLDPTGKPNLKASTPPLNIFEPRTIIWLDEFVCRFLNSTLFVEFDALRKQWNLYRALLSNSAKENQENDTSVICSHRDGKCFGPKDRIRKKFKRISDIILKQASMLSKNQSVGAKVSKDIRIIFLEQEDFHALAFIIRANATFNRYKTTEQYVEILDRRLKIFQASVPKDMYEIWYASRTMALFDMQRLIGKGTFQSLTFSIVIVALALLSTTANILMTVLSLLTITFILADTIAVFVLFGWTLNFMETIIIITAVGLSVDFTVHYGVAFLHAPEDTGQKLMPLSKRCSCCHCNNSDTINSIDVNSSAIQTQSAIKSQKSKKEANLRACIERVGPAVFMSAFTTFLAGMSMCPSKLTAFSQMGFFLMLIMVVSWTFATLFFLPLCLICGPTEHWCTIKLSKYFTCIRSKFQLKC